MTLSWRSSETGIAHALMQAYPEEDRLSLSLLSLQDKIENLAGFVGGDETPQDKQLRAILWTWMRLAGGDDENPDGDGDIAAGTGSVHIGGSP